MTTRSIDEAILAHRTWVARFRSAATGISTEKFDAAQAADDGACAFGQWLNSTASRQLSASSFEAIVEQHRAFHRMAAAIVVMLSGFQAAADVDEKINELHCLSKQLITLLLAAKKELSA